VRFLKLLEPVFDDDQCVGRAGMKRSKSEEALVVGRYGVFHRDIDLEPLRLVPTFREFIDPRA
jgi:hypothetical protein